MRGKMPGLVYGLSIWLAGVGLTGAQVTDKPAPKPGITPTHADVRYGPHDRNTLDLWQARGEGGRPLVIFIHGGGWHGGDKGMIPARLLQTLLDQGISVASINYRFVPENILPAPVHDAARAVQFLRSQAGAWSLDSARFGAYGISAGGCSALWLACHDDLADPPNSDPILRESTRLQAVVAVQAQTSLDPDAIIDWVGPQVMNHGMIRRAVGVRTLGDIQTRPELHKLLRAFSPINHVSGDDPPVLLSYPSVGAVPAPNAGAAIHHANFGIRFKEQADAAGLECILRIDDRIAASAPQPEEFLIQKLTP